MKLLVDMNLSPDWVATLTAAGHDAVHWIDVGSPTASDLEILRHARGSGRIVLTLDLDFGDILAATGGEAPSVVQVRAGRISSPHVAATVLRAIDEHRSSLEAGALLSVDLHRSRVRLLPIRPGAAEDARC